MLLHSIRLKNLLSFKDTTLELGPLNVLIGPNASGKSNLLAAISLLQAAPTDLNAAILRGGGAREWIWKGALAARPVANIECSLDLGSVEPPLVYELSFTGVGGVLSWVGERLSGPGQDPVYFSRDGGKLIDFASASAKPEFASISRDGSFLSQYKNPQDPTPTTRLGMSFEAIKIYHEFPTGPLSQVRTGMAAGGASPDVLADGGYNLALVLQEMSFDGSLQRTSSYLQKFWELLERVAVRAEGPILRIYVFEKDLDEPTSAQRLSDGTLKFLCLLAVLLNPRISPLVCIEEPEVGLHPDAIQMVAELLVEASQRTQLIVTTHSDALVDALSGTPESVVVCERDFDHSTQFKRLDAEKLAVWLEDYKLGELWRRGEIGGNRW